MWRRGLPAHWAVAHWPSAHWAPLGGGEGAAWNPDALSWRRAARYLTRCGCEKLDRLRSSRRRFTALRRLRPAVGQRRPRQPQAEEEGPLAGGGSETNRHLRDKRNDLRGRGQDGAFRERGGKQQAKRRLAAFTAGARAGV